jgi:hypothetical protein
MGILGSRCALLGNVRALATAAVLLAASVPGNSATLVDDSTLIGEATAPVFREFQIAQAGRYELRLSDVAFPAKLQSLQAAITRGDALIATLPQPGTILFDAAAGRYEVQVAGIASAASGFGSFAVRIAPAAGGAPVLDDSDSISSPPPPPPTGQTSRQSQFTVQTSGTYRIALSDAAFPEKLQRIDVLVTRGGVEYARLDAAKTDRQFAATPGSYDVLVVAQAAVSTNAGLYGLRVDNIENGQAVLDESYPVGTLGDARNAQLPADASYALTVTDLQFPTPLTGASAALMRGSTALAIRKTAGTMSFNATAGAARVFALPVPDAKTGVGALQVEVLQGTTRAFSDAYLASPPAASSAPSLSAYAAAIATAGAYRAALTDFASPAALLTLEMAVFQNAVSLGRRTGAGPLDFQGAPGKLLVLIAAQPSATTFGVGLYGLQIAAEPSGPVVYETTGAVGGLYQSRAIEVAAAGSYDVRLSDLEFPQRFTELSLAVTRGTTRVGSVYGGGKFSFAATPGTYFLNVIARVNSTAKFGTYGLRVETTPAAPAVTLTADPASVRAGESTKLSWSTTGVTSCAGSGAWSGTKATAGTESVGPLNSDSKFTLTCTGPGGTNSTAVTVTIKTGNSGGGGAIDAALLACLVGFALAARRRSVATNR